MASLSFSTERYDRSCAGRTGTLCIGAWAVPTPILWLGHSLKSRLLLGEFEDFKDTPLVVSLGDLVERNRLYERIVRTGIHAHVAHEGPIMVDSGGFKFTSHRSVPFSVSTVIDFYRDSGADIGVALDHPMSPLVSQQTNRRRWQRTVKDLKHACELAGDVPLVPVIHGLTLPQLRNACETVRSIIKNPVMLGLGSLVPLLKSSYIGKRFSYQARGGRQGNQTAFIADAIEFVRSEFPFALLHVFGAGSPASILAFFALGADSVDSVSWRIKAGYGAIILPGTSNRYLFERPHATRTRPTLKKKEKELLAACLCPVCREATFDARLTKLEAHFRVRALHNAWVVQQEVVRFRQALAEGQGKDYLAAVLQPQHRMYAVLANRL